MVRVRSSGPNIFETKRTVLTQNPDGSMKKTVILEQMAKVTKRENGKRKNNNSETEDQNQYKMTGEGERKQANIIDNVLEHLAGKDFETKSKLVAKLIDKEGPDFAALLTKHSKEIQQRFKFSPEQTAAMISGTRTGDNVWAKFRTASNKTIGFNTLASHKKVKHLRKQVLAISREDWQNSNHMLYKNKQGNNTRVQTSTCVLQVKNLNEYIQKIANSEADNLKHLKDGDNIEICYDADAGGGRFVAEFTIINTQDENIRLHPIVIYEGTDLRPNLEVVLSNFTQQFRDMENSIIEIDGEKLIIKQYGIFDLCALNCLMGKQNHSSTFFDAWTNVRLDHIQNHEGKQHIPSKCTDIKFLNLSEYDKNITHHSVETGKDKYLYN